MNLTQDIFFIADEPLEIYDQPDLDVQVVLSDQGLRGPPGSRVVELSFTLGGDIAPDEEIRHIFKSPINFLEDLCGAIALKPLGVPPVANVTFDISIDGTSIGSILFASTDSTKTGVFTWTPGEHSYASGILAITAPTDLADLGDVSITISGER